jgi:periplasmic protein TonB
MKIIIPTLLSVMLFSQFDFKEKITEKPLLSALMPQDTPKVDTDKNYDVVTKKAGFEGGDKEFVKFLSQNLQYPKKALRDNIEGTVYVMFIVDRDGRILQDCVKVSKSIHPSLDAEAVRVVRISPRWIPAQIDGRDVKQRIRVPIKFKITKDTKKTPPKDKSLLDKIMGN